MKLIDISMTIHPGMTVYKNRDSKRPVFKQSASFEENGVYETDVTFNLHTGTHVDFPLHTIQGGTTSDGHSLDIFVGKAKVFDLRHVVDHIDVTDLIGFDIRQGDFVLFQTKNSLTDAFDFAFIYLNFAAATYLVEKKIRGVGIDALGIERNQPNHPTHDALLHAGIIILEGLRLKEVVPKTYQLFCLPLKIAGVEALPVRALLIDNVPQRVRRDPSFLMN